MLGEGRVRLGGLFKVQFTLTLDLHFFSYYFLHSRNTFFLIRIKGSYFGDE